VIVGPIPYIPPEPVVSVRVPPPRQDVQIVNRSSKRRSMMASYVLDEPLEPHCEAPLLKGPIVCVTPNSVVKKSALVTRHGLQDILVRPARESHRFTAENPMSVKRVNWYRAVRIDRGVWLRFWPIGGPPGRAGGRFAQLDRQAGRVAGADAMRLGGYARSAWLPRRAEGGEQVDLRPLSRGGRPWAGGCRASGASHSACGGSLVTGVYRRAWLSFGVPSR
jgi:hypothetical protein